MNRNLSRLLFILFIALGVNCFAECNCPKPPTFIDCPKTYITPNQVAFSESEIFVQIDHCILQTESISADAQGIYFKNVRDGCGPSQWRCKRVDDNGMVCDTCNWEWNYTCSRCKKDKK
jgi:hypothetical protein